MLRDHLGHKDPLEEMARMGEMVLPDQTELKGRRDLVELRDRQAHQGLREMTERMAKRARKDQKGKMA